jgi:hypothetical protein
MFQVGWIQMGWIITEASESALPESAAATGGACSRPTPDSPFLDREEDQGVRSFLMYQIRAKSRLAFS